MRTSIRVSDSASPILKQARREVGRRTKEAMVEAAQQETLPVIRRFSPSVVQSIFTVRATLRGAYVTTSGKRTLDRIAGLLNFGGIVSTRIFPKQEGGVLHTPFGFFRVVYRGVYRRGRAARYEGKDFLSRAVVTSAPAFEDRIVPEILKAFHGADTSAAG